MVCGFDPYSSPGINIFTIENQPLYKSSVYKLLLHATLLFIDETSSPIDETSSPTDEELNETTEFGPSKYYR